MIIGLHAKWLRKFFILYIAFMFCFSSALFFPAQIKAETPSLGKYEKTSEPITINADTLEYDRGKDIYLANGHVEIIQERSD